MFINDNLGVKHQLPETKISWTSGHGQLLVMATNEAVLSNAMFTLWLNKNQHVIF